MVNLGKRMRRLKPLLSVRSGPGAAILPTPSPSSGQPRLTHVHLRFPQGVLHVQGPRLFWRNHLRRLKFHNPALPISVQHELGDKKTLSELTLTFEGTDVNALMAITKNVPKEPQREREQKKPVDEKSLAKKRLLAKERAKSLLYCHWRVVNPNEMKSELVDEADEVNEVANEVDVVDEVVDEVLGEIDEVVDEVVDEVDEVVGEMDEVDEVVDEVVDEEAVDEETLVARSGGRAMEEDDVVLKVPQPEIKTTGAGTPQVPIYIRIVRIGLQDRTSDSIWNWFRWRTNCTDVPQSIEDKKEYAELEDVFRQSAQDRERVKKGRDQQRANVEMLRRAKGEVEKLRAED